MALFFTFEDNRYNLLVYFLVTTIVLYLGPGFFFRQGPYSYSIEFQLTVLYNKNFIRNQQECNGLQQDNKR